MQELKATKAREIDRKSVIESEPLAVNGELLYPTDGPGMQAGDFYFRENYTTTQAESPTGFFKRLIWKLRGRPSSLSIELTTTIVMSCPFCGLPIMTTPSLHITSKNPLNITEAIPCPYAYWSTPHAFRVTGGQFISRLTNG